MNNDGELSIVNSETCFKQSFLSTLYIADICIPKDVGCFAYQNQLSLLSQMSQVHTGFNEKTFKTSRSSWIYLGRISKKTMLVT